MPHWMHIILGGGGGAFADGLLAFLLLWLHKTLNDGTLDRKFVRDDAWYGGCYNAGAGCGLALLLLLGGALLGGIGGMILASRR
ncbi:MAG TPA: hypothetical protein VFB21_16770 [Chthonomonadaceae bacterium]|nr:hypothetical protein [Chthonomonadaceae bacterium]